LSALARLARGVSAEQADAEMAVLDRQYKRENAGMPDADPAQTIHARDLAATDGGQRPHRRSDFCAARWVCYC